jgi:hypothetical protein
MKLSLARWRASHLMSAWAAYWVGLGAVTLRTAIVAGFGATQTGGSITGGMTDSKVGVTIVQKAGETLQMSAPIGTIAAWVVIPPLLLWALWLMRRNRAEPHRERNATPDALQPGWQDLEPPGGRNAHKPRIPLPDER